jgi:hypothetical protein
MAMGGAAGLAAALAVKGQTVVSEIDLPALQVQLVEQGILSQEELETWTGSRRVLTKAEVEKMVACLMEGELDLPGKVTLLTQGERALAALRPALAAAEATQAKVEIARALCYLDDTTGVPVLLDAIERQTAKGLPPGQHMRHRYPDHGWAPEPVYLIYAVGLTGDPRLIPVLKRVAEQIVIGRKELDANFEYVLAICQAAERSGAEAMVPVLEELAKRPGLRGLTLRYDSDPRQSVSVDHERRAYLELCIARALARCGAAQGCRTLIEYLTDTRGFLARSAHDELAVLAGEDLGYGRRAWREWLEANGSTLASKPFRKRLD